MHTTSLNPHAFPDVLNLRTHQAKRTGHIGRQPDGLLCVPYDEHPYHTIVLPRVWEAVLARAYGGETTDDRAVLGMKEDETWPHSHLGQFSFEKGSRS